MSWPFKTFASVKKIIIFVIQFECWTTPPGKIVGFYIVANHCHVLYILTTDVSFFFYNNTSSIWLTNNPVIDIRLDHELSSTDVLPKIPVYCSKWRFTEWWSSWDWDLDRLRRRPVWSWGYCIACRPKIVVIREGVAVNQGPASPVSFHVTVNLKCGIQHDLDPIDPWWCEFIFSFDLFTGPSWV